ncbi:MAG TPA: hypothetical protein VFV38_04930 [Ktedonobacteraceae bacterium]|nr:hypothetical protein [Ktedonobacteraceae bacterium]
MIQAPPSACFLAEPGIQVKRDTAHTQAVTNRKVAVVSGKECDSHFILQNIWIKLMSRHGKREVLACALLPYG